MSKITICPTLLIHNENLEPSIIERDYILPIVELFEMIDCYSVELVLELNILNKICEKFPWNMFNDNKWKGYLKNWQQLLFSKISKKSLLIDSSNTIDNLNIGCHIQSEEINILFSKFLNDFGTTLRNEKFEEGIFIHSNCTEKNLFYNFNVAKNIINVTFPWLIKYDEKLPYKGQFIFIPKENWRDNIVPHGNQNGILDINDNEWCWDRLHNNHWDVQLFNGGYKNVSSDGKIL